MLRHLTTPQSGKLNLDIYWSKCEREQTTSGFILHIFMLDLPAWQSQEFQRG